MLKANDLTVGYQNRNEFSPVLKQLNFEIEQGHLCALVGVNGSGKSTLLRCLSGFLKPLSGEILFDHKLLNSYTPNDLAKHRAVVLTEALATQNLDVESLLAMGRQPYTNWLGKLSPTDRKAIQEGLLLFDLEAIQNKKCHELSDGQLQRVLIARASVQGTPAILLDEPTAHLDLHHKVQVLQLLKRLTKEQDKTIVFATHEIELAIQLCDSMLILDGKQNPFGAPEKLIEDGCFDTLFPSELVRFNVKTSRFTISD